MNGVIRMIIRLVVVNGLRQGIDWFFKRRAETQIDENTPQHQQREFQSQSRKQAQTTKRGMNVLRRFIRF